VPAGEAFTERQSEEILRSLRIAEHGCGLHMSVYVGDLDGDPRARAQELHAQFGSRAPLTVLVAVDPANRRVEIVTGSEAQHRLDDRACALASLSMTSAFSAGDLAGGIATGVRMLGDHASGPRTLHTDQTA
jgi:Domain of unknown function (DUF5130)